jgi:hypothetical protein
VVNDGADMLPAGVFLTGAPLWDVIVAMRLRVATSPAPPRVRALLALLEVAGRVSAVGSVAPTPAAGVPRSAEITSEEVGEMLGCTSRTVRTRCARGDFASARKRAGVWIVDQAEVLGRLNREVG